ncbi:RMD1 family protein [Flavihumibacter petaseus]|uniref:DUF155 domain-containing protein n=1 Tax=Flavihumibacter petaseus NBRC 106054 TaxID=1220578 RepID=A0A0E9N3F6_9BACT|nr:RMD1 family protein [Flavihumibacter petaseus]GAO44502.1 hypothetical protein FPE01S_03_05390 [Flavihumibacter petaseus NBRC 106054]
MDKVQAFQVADAIDLRQFKAAFTGTLYFSDAEELFYVLERHQFLYVFKYGVVCLLNHSEVETTQILQLIDGFCKNPLPEKLQEEFEIDARAGKLTFGFDQVGIPRKDTDMYRLVMLYVSQSVALDHFEKLSDQLLNETNYHTQVLERKGRIELKGLNMKKYIGKVLNLKNRISANLYVFDSPESTWEDEDLLKLDAGLKKTFDIQSRFRNIQESLGIVSENFELFKDLLQYRNSVTLEWIIIILIFVEVLNLILEKLMR